MNENMKARKRMAKLFAFVMVLSAVGIVLAVCLG